MALRTTTVLFNLIYCISLSQGQYYRFDNLGEHINRQVQQSLKPLENLGSDINNQVQYSLKPVRNLGSRINNQVQRDVADWESGFQANLQQQLAPLENLGDRIQQQVYQGLEPVRIMESKLKVMQGSGGTTVATFSPIDKRFVIRNGELLECDGSISNSDGSCSGTLNKVKFEKKEDFCFSLSRARINNWYCITPEGASSTGYINGKIICKTRDGSPSLLIEDRDYRELCKNVASAAYKYYTNNKLQNVGDGLECSGDNPQVCTYTQKLNNDGSNYFYSGNGNVFISN